MKKTIFFFLFLLFLISGCTLNRSHKNIVIAHRGAWKTGQLPQNSIASLNQAIALKVFGTEFDVHLTKDNIPVVNHDHNFYGIQIEESTYGELLVKKLPNGEQIPTLKEYLQKGMIPSSKTKLIIELKPSKISKERTLELATAAVNLVKELRAEKMVEYISFYYPALQKILALNPLAKVHYLAGDVPPEKARKDGITGLDYNAVVYKKNPEWIPQAQQLGLVINVWTVNKVKDMNYFLHQKVNYISTDEPELLLNLLQTQNAVKNSSK